MSACDRVEIETHRGNKRDAMRCTSHTEPVHTYVLLVGNLRAPSGKRMTCDPKTCREKDERSCSKPCLSRSRAIPRSRRAKVAVQHNTRVTPARKAWRTKDPMAKAQTAQHGATSKINMFREICNESRAISDVTSGQKKVSSQPVFVTPKRDMMDDRGVVFNVLMILPPLFEKSKGLTTMHAGTFQIPSEKAQPLNDSITR